METAITVNDVHLRYETIQRKSLLNPAAWRQKRIGPVDALKGVSFQVRKGEILGIVGTNGSGKSTLLRTVAGLMSPNSGTIDLHGNTVALLSLGTGFLPEVSGRDNIYLSGLSMGFSKAEIDERYETIVSFSELEDAISRPVKTYSSGMYSKLAFSIAVSLETDILLIDEVLSVGDLRFQRKSHAALENLIMDKNRTVLIVSHNLGELQRLCTSVMWLEEGTVAASGGTAEVLELYHKKLAEDPTNLSYLDPPIIQVESGAKAIRLHWDAVKFAEDYRIYRKENLPGAQWSAIVDGYDGLEYEDVPPSGEISYLYTIRARATNKNGNVWSNYRAGVAGKLEKETGAQTP